MRRSTALLALGPLVLSASLALSSARGQGPTCAVIGDSLTWQDGVGRRNVDRALRAEGLCSGGLWFWGVGGKQVGPSDRTGRPTVHNVREAREALGTVDRWLVALGTNDLGTDPDVLAADVTAVLDEIGPGQRVDWVGVGIADPHSASAAAVNAVIAETLDGEPDGAPRTRPQAAFHDWNGWVHDPERDDPSLWRVGEGDPLHLSASGYRLRAAYYADVLGY